MAAQLGDQVSLGVLTSVFPPDLVDEVLARAGVSLARTRRLPPRMLTYFVLACALWQAEPQDEVFAQLTEGLWWGDLEGYEPSPSSLSDGRARIGPEPLKMLFDEVKGPLAADGAAGSFWLGRRVVVFDGTTLDLADTPENETVFGRSTWANGVTGTGADKGGADKGANGGPWPQARVMVAVEAGTLGLLDAVIGPYQASEKALLGRLLGGVGAGDVLVVDRNFLCWAAWRQALATGACLVWRAKGDSPALPVIGEPLGDGSWLSRLRPPEGQRRGNAPITVRVCEYALQAGSTGAGDTDRQVTECVTLVTDILDTDQASIEDLAGLYGLRYPTAEGGIAAFKTLQRGSGVVLRSRKPEGVYQEIYAILAVYQALRRLICQAVDGTKISPARVPFTRALKEARRQTRQGAANTPNRLAKAITLTTKRLLKRLTPTRRHPRAWPRTLKRSRPRYPHRTPDHHGGPIHRELTIYRLHPQPSG